MKKIINFFKNLISKIKARKKVAEKLSEGSPEEVSKEK